MHLDIYADYLSQVELRTEPRAVNKGWHSNKETARALRGSLRIISSDVKRGWD